MENSSLGDRVERALIDLLAQVWLRVDWRKISRNRNPMDVFQHRLKVASYENSITKVIEKLCHGLSLQSVDVPPDLIQLLRQNEADAIDMLRENSVYFVIMAKTQAKERR